MTNYLALKSGTDVRGVALGTSAPAELTEYAAARIASAFYLWAKRKLGKEKLVVAVGCDSRLTAWPLARAVEKGIMEWGGDIRFTGYSSTPSMFMLLQDDFGADASVMITASHLPKEMNGLKFFLKEGGLEEEEITEILQLASAPFVRTNIAMGEVLSEISYIGTYADRLVRLVEDAAGPFPLEGKRIIVDAGNGVGAFYADLVLAQLGADIEGSQFLRPDGNFPNHIPNPEDAAAMQSLSEAVVANHADLGIIFDTDVDRAAIVSSDGKEINRNRLIALTAALLLEEQPGCTIVTDSVTSDGLTAFIEAHGGVHRRFKRGYRNVINEAKRINAEGGNAVLAIETSGHAAFRENYFLDDGAYLVTRLIIAFSRAEKEGRPLLSYIEDLKEPLEAIEVRPRFVAGCDFKTEGKKILEALSAFVENTPYLTLAPENCEGVRINFDAAHGDGWALVRMSLHEPILPINLESNSAGGTKRMLRELNEFLQGYPMLDPAALKKSLEE